ncbi:MAG: LysM peptidoglycan-binding domain-containing protein [Chloroflexi bacterium]|nr:LysM peptidoglycan-binding domain-containing protein [Chloroflexota bacterium]
MRIVRQVLPGILVALVSVVLILGGFTLSLAEGNVTAPTRTLTQTQSPTVTPTWQPFTPPPPSPTVPSPTTTLTLPPPPTTCPPPAGWVAYGVQFGDTLEVLATRYHTSAEMLLQANCLVSDSLLPDSVLYVPPVSTRTLAPCGPPPGWVLYPVQPGDTLYRLSLAYGITVRQLQNANCMGNSTIIIVGKWIYVPPWAPHTPSPTSTQVFTPTSTWTVITPYTPTSTGTPTDTPTATTVTPP